ncbi:MAG TPA: redoxin domain-containing protein [Candidatus Acidoferrales bacterium]|nr:redoxin domain-containing protein [Candidatus Acidoferrales bacterium]
MMRFLAAVAFGLAATLPVAAVQASPAGPGLVLGDPAPAFDLPTIDGKHVTLEDLRGKTVVINVWATWCPPCQEETANLIKAYNQTAGDDVVFMGVDSTETAPLVKAFAAAKNIKFLETVDAHQTFAKAYHVKYFPTTYVIGPDGVLRMVYIDLVTPKLVAQFVADAQAGRNSKLSSPIQDKVDALLAPSKYAFVGDPAQVSKTVDRFQKTVARVSDMIDNSDPVAGNPIDVPRTEAEENNLRTEAIAAMKPIASTHARKVTLDLLMGDANQYAGKYADALSAYIAAHLLEPKNEDALSGMAFAAGRLKDYDVVIRSDEELVALEPHSVSAFVDLGVESGSAKRFDEGRRAFDRAVALASAKADAPHAKATDIRMLAWAHLYYGRMEAKAGNIPAARRQFADATRTTLRLPKTNSRYAIYLEQAQEETVALDIRSASRTSAALSFAPWTGPQLPGSSPDTAKYRLVVTGKAGQSIHLHAVDLPKGWIASFCTDRICAPLQVATTLPDSGVKVIEFQVVPPDAKSLAHVPSVRVIVTDGKSTASARTLALRS